MTRKFWCLMAAVVVMMGTCVLLASCGDDPIEPSKDNGIGKSEPIINNMENEVGR